MVKKNFKMAKEIGREGELGGVKDHVLPSKQNGSDLVEPFMLSSGALRSC